MPSEYAKAGVDIKKIHPFKELMGRIAARTIKFPNARGVEVIKVRHAHGGLFKYRGLIFCVTLEGLGNKNWPAELLYHLNPQGSANHKVVGYDTAMMGVNDNIAQGARPIIYLDEVAASRSEWFADMKRAQEFGEGVYEACLDAGMALVAGESPAYVYLINPRPPVKEAGVFSGCVVGVITRPSDLITGELLQPGDAIIAIPSSGVHSNGHSLLIKTGLEMPGGFSSRLPSGQTFGEAILTPTRCYVQAVERLLDEGIEIHAFLPGTGGGVAKLAWDKREYQYHIHSWVKVHEIFLLMRELGKPMLDLLSTFNWGAGYYAFVPKREVQRTLDCLHDEGHLGAAEVGEVKEGKRGTVFGPENNLWLPPPEE